MADLGPGSEAVANYVAICHNIADDYPDGIAHGLQKDAIQNSLDARKSRSTVRVEFNLIENKCGNFLTFTDSNTIGLTGDVKSSVNDYTNLKKDDHWARFEAFAFTKDDPDALGARGQGKFIFLRASEHYKMFYDTLRDDGVYRLGATEVTTTGRSVHPKRGERWEDTTAESILEEHCGLSPLGNVGTRIVVCQPIDEVLDAVRGGAFTSAIQETWFRAIEKNQLEICINIHGKILNVGPPKIYPLPTKDSRTVKSWVYKQDFDDVTVSDNFKIKNFHAVYLPKRKIPEEQQGIAILQNGMKITTLGMEFAPTEIKEKITGFIEFDKPLDQELRKGYNQHPNHYQLKWRSRTPRNIKAFIQRQLQEFGRKKLGIGEDRRARRKRNRDAAEKEAMALLLRHAPDLDLGRIKSRRPLVGEPVPDPVPPTPPSHKEIGISMAVQFPDNTKKPRVDWGDELLVSAFCFNKTTRNISGNFAIRVLQADSIIQKLADVEIDLLADSVDSRTVKINNGAALTINLDQTLYKIPGEHRIRAILTDTISGDKIDIATRKFWLEENPPQRLPFELTEAQLGEYHAWLPVGDIDNHPEILYNIDHPHFKQVQDDELEHADYLFNICLEGALHFILTRPHSDADEPDYHPLDTASIVNSEPELVPEKVYGEISKYIAKVRWHRFEE